MKRRIGLAQADARMTDALGAPPCALCLRPLGRRIEWHHLVPKSRGGTVTAPVHPICHRAIHAHVSNRDLALNYADPERLRERPDIARFVRWLVGKPHDFDAPTRRARDAR